LVHDQLVALVIDLDDAWNGLAVEPDGDCFVGERLWDVEALDGRPRPQGAVEHDLLHKPFHTFLAQEI